MQPPKTEVTDVQPWVKHIPLEERAANVDTVVQLLSEITKCKTLVHYHDKYGRMQAQREAARPYQFFALQTITVPKEWPDWAGLDNDPHAITCSVTFAPNDNKIQALNAIVHNEEKSVKVHNEAAYQLGIEKSTAQSEGRYVAGLLNKISQRIQEKKMITNYGAVNVPFQFRPLTKNALREPNDTTFSIGFSTAPSALSTIIECLEEIKENPELISSAPLTCGMPPQCHTGHAKTTTTGERSH